MSYPDNPHERAEYRPAYQVPVSPAPAKANPGLTFLGMSGGVLFLVLALVLLLPMVCCGVLCLMGAFGAAVDPSPTPTP